MQNLGKIDININQRGGGGAGGGGSGTPGGGPSAAPPVVTMADDIGNFVETLKSVTQGFGELKDFISGPTLSGFLNLTSQSSSVGRAMAALGPAATIGFGALLAVVGVAVVGLGMLSAAADKVSERIQEVQKFSGAVAYATATEKLAQFTRTIKDAEKNGAAYARVQELATYAADMEAAAMREFNGALTAAADVWYRLTALFWKALKPIAEVANLMANLGDTVRSLSLMADMSGSRALQFIVDMLQEILSYLGIVVNNTKPKPQTGRNANMWYINDLNAVMGSNVRY